MIVVASNLIINTESLLGGLFNEMQRNPCLLLPEFQCETGPAKSALCGPAKMETTIRRDDGLDER